ncbi:MAG TPA: 3D domain-containing protein [Vicinamibacterales bacterium]|jgi:3D (Asp-Asp-Asp) domain-containing protein
MLLARSFWLKAFVTTIAAGLFVRLYEVTIPDSKFSMLPLGFELSADAPARPSPGVKLTFTATAYCKGLITTAGVPAQSGILASDPTILPLGTIVDLDYKDDRFDGIFTVLDTGPEIQGREVDVYMWSCNDALKFGRRPVSLTVLRLGWNPRATTPGFMDRLFRRPSEPAPEPLPSRPFPVQP